MHTVKCTHCGRSLTIAKPVVQGKIRCPACGNVFLGSTRPVGASAPPGPAEASRPDRPAPPAAPAAPERPESPEALGAEPAVPPVRRRPAPVALTPVVPDAPDLAQAVAQAQEAGEAQAAGQKRPAAPRQAVAVPLPATFAVPRKSKKGLYLGLMLGAFVLFLGVAVYILATHAGRTYTEERDTYGRVTRSGWLTPEEAERWRQEGKVEANVIVVRQPGPSPRTSARRGEENPANPRITMAELNAQSQPAATGEPELPEVKALPEDAKIQPMAFEKITLPGSTDAGLLAGTVSSKYDSPLQTLELTIQVVDARGRTIATLAPFTCQYVPAEGTARYSVKFAAVPEEAIDRVRASAKATPMGKGQVCYEAEVSPTLDWQEKTVTVTGTARNGGLKPLGEAFVHVEFYTREWTFVRAARGELEEDAHGRIAPGRRVRFTAQLKLDEGEDSQRIHQALARVVGKEE